MRLVKFLRKKRHKTADGKLALVLEKNGIDLFLDVGANIGQTGLKLRENGYPNRILSFEPVLPCHEKLRMAARGDRNWQVFERLALGDYDGETEIFLSEATDLSSIGRPTDNLNRALPRARAAATDKVSIRRLDSLFPDGFGAGRVFLKVDAQGCDLAVLKGAEKIFDRISGVQVEASLIPLYENEPDYLDVLGFLHDAGMRPHIVAERTFSRQLCRQLQIDVIFFRE